VAGAGVIGLATALRLLEAGWRVVIVSEFRYGDGNTTSDVPAAFW
jgi:glycine/D-amino acid oxidase-like deaminating enzyme